MTMHTEAPKLRWGIVGASQIARNWVANAIRSVEGAELVAVMSRDETRGRAFADALGIASVATSYDALFDRVDAVYVCTGNDRHAEATLAAARAGKHVLCEKPLSLKLEEAVAMVEACEKAGVVLATNHHMRGAETHKAIRELVRSGRIGRPLAARAMYCEYLPEELQTWRTHDKLQGGVIYDLTVHNVDALRFVLDDDPVEVMSMTSSDLIGRNGVEDQAQSVVRFRSGLIAYLHESQALGHHETALEVHGTDGSIYGRGVLHEKPAGAVFLRRGDEMTEVPTDPVNLYEATVRRFHEAVFNGGQPAASGWDGIISLATALAVRRSADSGMREPVELPVRR